MIGIINYGLGNVKAFANIYRNYKIPHKLVSAADDFEDVTKIILPGVGSFDHAMTLLETSPFYSTLNEYVLNKKMPTLGICVGMQILAKRSDEGKKAGLGWIDGEVRKFDFSNANTRYIVPHMGWNTIESRQTSPILHNIENGSEFYFLHSYYFDCENDKNIVASSKYSKQFTSIVQAGNVYGVQFHPEKSHAMGTQLLINFSGME